MIQEFVRLVHDRVAPEHKNYGEKGQQHDTEDSKRDATHWLLSSFPLPRSHYNPIPGLRLRHEHLKNAGMPECPW